MSPVRPLLNTWMRLVEKPRVRRANHPALLRRALERNRRIFFHPPRGTQQSWTRLGCIDALEVVPPNLSDTRRVLFYIHGGGFTFGSPRTHAALAAQLAHRLGIRAVLPRYGLAPEAPYPAAPDDIAAAWRGLIDQSTAPGDVILGGDSAGGALAFGLSSTLCTTGAAKPMAVFGFSPLTDLRYSGESFARNAKRDVFLPAQSAAKLTELFFPDGFVEDARVSPLAGDHTGAPPYWVTVGDTEILLDDARRLVALAQDSGVEATLVLRRDLPHVWPIMHAILPEARQTLDQLAGWIRQQPGWRDES
ncbi:MAG: alpha/beta hydrolase [Pseudomonadota bacterium]